jgi:hypothetical protein
MMSAENIYPIFTRLSGGGFFVKRNSWSHPRGRAGDCCGRIDEWRLAGSPAVSSAPACQEADRDGSHLLPQGTRASSGTHESRDRHSKTPNSTIGMGPQCPVQHAVQNSPIDLCLLVDHRQRRSAPIVLDDGRPLLVTLPRLGVERRHIDTRPRRKVQVLWRLPSHLAGRRNIVVKTKGLESRSGEMILPVANKLQ